MGEFGGYVGIFEIKALSDHQTLQFAYKYYSSSFVIMYVITAALVMSITWIVMLLTLVLLIIFAHKQQKMESKRDENELHAPHTIGTHLQDLESFKYTE